MQLVWRTMMWHPDGRGSRAKIGILTPHLDPVPESEFQAMAPTGVSVHAARVPLGMINPDGEIIPRVDPEIAIAFSRPPAVDDAVSLLSAVDLNAIVYAFTSSSYILGMNADRQLKARLETRAKGVTVIIQAQAVISALRELGAGKIALIHPPWFSDELDGLGARYYEAEGLSVISHGSARLCSDYGDIQPQEIFDWAKSNAPDAAEAVVIGGGGFRAIGAVEALEATLKKPVLSANQTAFWAALRESGISDDLKAYGMIFQKSLSHH